MTAPSKALRSTYRIRPCEYIARYWQSIASEVSAHAMFAFLAHQLTREQQMFMQIIYVQPAGLVALQKLGPSDCCAGPDMAAHQIERSQMFAAQILLRSRHVRPIRSHLSQQPAPPPPADTPTPTPEHHILVVHQHQINSDDSLG